MARKTESNPDRDLFISECMRDYAKYFVVRGYADTPTPEAIAQRVELAMIYYDTVVAPFRIDRAPEIGKK